MKDERPESMGMETLEKEQPKFVVTPESGKGADWLEVERMLGPFDEKGAANPLVKFHADDKSNPFWEESGLGKAFENGNVPFGPVDLMDNHKWQMDPTASLEFGRGILAVFDELGSRLNPEVVSQTIRRVAEGQVSPEMAAAGGALVAKIWENYYDFSAGKPRRANLLGTGEIESLAGGEEEKLAAYWLTLKAYLNGVGAHYYTAVSGSLGMRDWTEADGTINPQSALEMVFLDSCGRSLSGVNKPPRQRSMADMPGAAIEYFEDFSDFYGRVLTHPLLVANAHAADYLEASTVVGKNVTNLYRRAAEQSQAIPLDRLFEFNQSKTKEPLELERV